MPTPPPAEALLCERCGYDMSPLGLARPCPECGADVAADVAFRDGSRSQRRGRLARRLGDLEVVLYSRRTFLAMQVPGEEDDVRLGNTLLAASVLVAAGPFAATCIFIMRIALGLSPGDPFAGPGLTALALGILACGTLIVPFPAFLVLLFCANGLAGAVTVVGRRRGWRTPGEVVSAVQAHAASAILLWSLVWMLAWIGSSAKILPSGLLTLHPIGFFVVSLVVPLLGFVHFVVLLTLGLHTCRFANTPAALARNAPATVDSRDSIVRLLQRSSDADPTTN